MMNKYLKTMVFCMFLVGLFLNIGLSATTIKTNKEVYNCYSGKCEPVQINISTDLTLYTVKINWDTKTGDLLTVKLPYVTTTSLSAVTIVSSVLPKTTTYSFYFNATAYGSVKFNISVYDSLGKLVSRLDPWFNESCLYKKNLTYYNNAWNDEDLINFPVLIVINATTINYSLTNSNDIRFYDENGVRLNKEIELWNDTGNSYIWVKDINISGTDDRIEMYYSCIDTDTNDYTDVWDKNYYLHVYHFGNNSQDSSFYGQNGTITGATLTTSPIGNAYSYDGNDVITITSPLLPLGTMNRTITAFVKPINTASHSPIVSYSQPQSSAGKRCVLASYNNNLVWWFFTTDFISALPVTNNIWTYVSGVLSANAVVDNLYSNTASQTKSDHTGIDSQQSDLTIGFEDSDNNYWTGIIDEVRIENTSRSAKWINATYFSMLNQFISFGDEEEFPPSNYLIITPVLPVEENQTALPIIFNISVEGSSDYFNCSLYINGTLNETIYNIVNNTGAMWSLNMTNGTYNYNYSCFGVISNNTDELPLNIMVAYPLASFGNCTLYILPENDKWTKRYCFDNNTEYHERIYSLGGILCNYSEFKMCDYGCESNQCNDSPAIQYQNLLYFLIALVITIAIIIYIGIRIKI